MIFLDQMKESWSVLRLKKMNASKDFLGTLKFFYKATFIPFLIAMVVTIVVTTGVSSAIPSANSVGLSVFLNLVFGILGWVIFAPIGFIVFAGITHIVGLFIGKFKSSFMVTFDTITRVACGQYLLGIVSSLLILILVPTLLVPALAKLSLSGIVIGSSGLAELVEFFIIVAIIALVIVIWEVIVSTVWVARRQKTSGVRAFVSLYLVPIVLIVIVVLALAGLLAATAA